MSDTIMPAVEAEQEVIGEEPVAYELAFHVLPTVAEGEVDGVFTTLKSLITKAGGEVFDTEAPQRFDLAYEIIKYLEGRNRRFSSAYFGWIRFRLTAAALAELTEEVDNEKNLLRYLLVRLTKEEEQAPFRFHESLVDVRVRTITDEEVVADEVVEVVEGEEAPKVEAEVVGGEESK